MASHARRRRKPSIFISSISFMRQAVAESSGESGRTIGSYSSRSVSRADRALASFASPHSQSARAGLASHQPEVYTFLSIAILDMLNIMGLDGGRACVVMCAAGRDGCAFVDQGASGSRNYSSSFQNFFQKYCHRAIRFVSTSETLI